MKPNAQDPDPAQTSARLDAAHRTAKVLVLVFAASIVFYTVIGVVIFQTAVGEPRPFQHRIPFFVAVLFLSLGSIALRRTQFRWLRLEVIGGLKGVEGLIKHLSTMTIISAALAETIGLLALIIVFFGGDMRDIITVGAVGLLVALSSYPRRAAWRKIVEYFVENRPGVTARH